MLRNLFAAVAVVCAVGGVATPSAASVMVLTATGQTFWTPSGGATTLGNPISVAITFESAIARPSRATLAEYFSFDKANPVKSVSISLLGNQYDFTPTNSELTIDSYHYLSEVDASAAGYSLQLIQSIQDYNAPYSCAPPFSPCAQGVVSVPGGKGSAYYSSLTLAPLSAVPEPTSWALMITGLGFVGASLRRRRRIALRT